MSALGSLNDMPEGPPQIRSALSKADINHRSKESQRDESLMSGRPHEAQRNNPLQSQYQYPTRQPPNMVACRRQDLRSRVSPLQRQI